MKWFPLLPLSSMKWFPLLPLPSHTTFPFGYKEFPQTKVWFQSFGLLTFLGRRVYHNSPNVLCNEREQLVFFFCLKNLWIINKKQLPEGKMATSIEHPAYQVCNIHQLEHLLECQRSMVVWWTASSPGATEHPPSPFLEGYSLPNGKNCPL